MQLQLGKDEGWKDSSKQESQMGQAFELEPRVLFEGTAVCSWDVFTQPTDTGCSLGTKSVIDSLSSHRSSISSKRHPALGMLGDEVASKWAQKPSLLILV